MFVESIPLRFAGLGLNARMRELTGRDEFEVLGTNTANAIRLLSSLLEDRDGLDAADLVASDRDRLLAAVYRRAFGDRIESTITCARCSQPFDLDFSLRQLIKTVDDRSDADDWTFLGDGRFESSTGASFRLPTGRDELELSALSPAVVEQSLLKRCTEESGWTESQTAFEELLERVAPLLDLELVAQCVECGHRHTVQFDIQTYVLGAIVGERRRLLTEINRLARAYSWSLAEILSLRRSDRRQFVELIENEYVT
ncbi:MAG TPA: hypothetical protein VI306_18765 [Pyrinomonadaceae bacterium]